MFPALTRSIIPGWPLETSVVCRMSPEAGSISIKRLTPTSVTNAVPVIFESVTQQVASWPVMLALLREVAFSEEGSMASVVAPKAASVAKTLLVPGIAALPNNTAVPLGELRISLAAMAPLATGRADMKPVLLAVGSPLTMVRKADSSALSRT